MLRCAARTALAVLLAFPAVFLGARAADAEAQLLNGFEITRHRVPRDEIVKGGPPRDAIRAVDHPRFEPAGAATWMRDDLTVLGVEHRGEARAYPLYFLEWHLIVNDIIGGEPVVVTFDALTGTPRAYRRVVRGNRLDFGVSGLLYNGSMLLYDRSSESLWSQFRGDAVAGRFAGSRLEPIAVVQSGFGRWKREHPETQVLLAPEDARIAYVPGGGPYEPYYQVDKAPFPVQAEDRRFHAKEMVLGVVAGGESRAYLGSIVARHGGRAEDRVGGVPVRVEFLSDERVFRVDVPPDTDVTESFWFAWKAWHPDTDIWRDPGSVPGRSR